MTNRWKALLIVGGIAVLVVNHVSADFPDHYNEVQSLRPWVLEHRLSPADCGDPPLESCILENIAAYRDGVTTDWWFMALYGIGGAMIAVGALGNRLRAMTVALAGLAAAVTFDLLETLRVNEALGRAARHVRAEHQLVGLDLGDLPRLARGFAVGKVVGLALGVGVFLWFVASTTAPVNTWRNRKKQQAEVFERQPRPPGAPWDPPPTGERLGVCCSGGGTRSASFSLGALQALQDEGKLETADYLAAASGGGYISAGVTVAEANRKIWANNQSPPSTDPPAYAVDSPETAYLRRHSSYLLPDFWKGATAVARLVSGLLVNLLIVWMVLLVMARPVGWLISELHPEREAVLPVAIPGDDDEAEVAIADVVELDPIEAEEGGAIRRWSVTLAPVEVDADADDVSADEDQDGTAGFDVLPFGLPDESVADEQDPRYGVVADGSGIVELRGGKASVVRQPTVKADTAACGDDEEPDPGMVAGGPADAHALAVVIGCSLSVDDQPSLGFDDDTFGTPAAADTTGDLRDELEVDQQPTLTSETGLNGRGDITIDDWMWHSVAVTTGFAAGASMLVMLRRIRVAWRKTALGVLWIIAAVVFAVLVAAPWLDQELFAGANRLAEGKSFFDDGGGGGTPWWEDRLAPTGGLLALIATALGRFFSSNQTSTTGDTAKTETSRVKRLWGRLSGRSKELGWYELSATKIVASIAVLVGAVAIFVANLQFASANGYDGQLTGTPVVRSLFDEPSDWLVDYQKWIYALLGLIVVQRVVDAHATSIYPYYKQRLSGAFLLKRTRKDIVRPVTYGKPLPFHEPWEVSTGEAPLPSRPKPELILCCAVNLSEVGATPPGRKAASFTFSATEVGGPEVGYLTYQDYWDAMGRSRKQDLTIPSAMAISGAAFSPAMGKKNLGPVGALFALANLRLGVWLPHPRWVEANGDSTWRHRPGWSWFGREILNRYKLRSEFLYVSDGGHWENLGLVELLRRGCTQIVCINAGGDGQESFGTIGEAMALAREELGVKFNDDFDPSPLRPPTKADEKGRLLRRQATRDKPSPLATSSFVTGTYELKGRTGRIWLIEPALTSDMPFDVQVFAEAEAIFPDDSTADLVYNHRQFESFRALGQHQAGKVLEDMALTPAEREAAAKKPTATEEAKKVADVAAAAGGPAGFLSRAIAAALEAAGDD